MLETRDRSSAGLLRASPGLAGDRPAWRDDRIIR